MYILNFHGNETKITACILKENQNNPDIWGQDFDIERYIALVEPMEEWILPARLTDETFRGILNLFIAIMPGTPVDEIENALVS